MEKNVWDNEHESGKMHVLFIGHGSPMNIIQKNGYTDTLAKLGARAYLPMIYAIGLQEKEETLKFVYEGIQHGSVSMRAFQIG